MAVAVAMFAFSCATDTTEDLGVQVGNGANGEGGATIELTLSLEDSRTQLGKKVDGLYPLYWSDGDKISVNGIESGEAVIDKSNPACATFTVEEAEKYNVAYPAAPEGQVLFAEKQSHVSAGNTFASGVSTMYGTCNAGEYIQLHHLTGVLKIGIRGEATLSKIQISTVDRAPIAGAFDIDFETGKLTATAASKKVIEYSFGESGFQLYTTADAEGNEAAEWIYVAVPAGVYDELYVTLYEQGNAGNITYATVKADEKKPLAAGSVREFNTPITYAPNAQVFVINSAEQLVDFKAAIEAEGGLAMDAVFTEDIDMTGVAWTPIAGANYTNTIHGNGYAIKGLTAPLFHTTSSSIKGLHLVDVNMVSNITAKADRMYGALVGSLKPATGITELSVENCSVSGTMKLHNPNYAVRDNIFFGGLIGTSYGAVIDSCESSVTITNDQYNDGSVTIKSFGLGGVVGLATSLGEMYTSISNTKFAGTINLNIKEQIGTNANVAGIVGYIQGQVNLVSNVSNCESSGTIKFQAAASANNVYVGGIAGTASEGTGVLNMSDCKSSGEVEVSGTITTASVGGVAGLAAVKTATVNMTDCENSAAVAIGGTIGTPYVGGITGYAIGNADSAFTELTNSGSVTVKSGAVMSGTSAISGIAGAAKSCHMDTIVNDGAIVVEEGAKIATCYIGGITGIGTKDGAVTTVQNLTNNGSITYNGEPVDATTATMLRVGGVIAYTQSAILNATNRGNITIAGSLNPNIATPETFTEAKGDCYAGVVGYKTATSTNKVTNTGTITVSSNMNSLVPDGKDEEGNTVIKYAQVNIGGLVGYTSNSINGTNETEYTSVSSGDIIVSGNTTKCTLCIGGSIAHHYYAGGQNNETCSSDIRISGTHTGNLYVGGVISAAIYSCDNLTFNGSIVVEQGTQIGGQCHVGGCVSSIISTAAKAEDVPVGTNLTNTGTITVGATTVAGIVPNIAGCVGYNDHTTEATGVAFAAPLSNLTNTGAVTYNGVALQGNVFVAGCVGRCRGALTTANNSGTITYAGNTLNTAKKIAYAAGVAAAMNNSAYDAHNSGKVKCVDGAQYYELGLGGVFANVSGLGSSQKYEKCSNSGALSNEAQASETASLGTLKIAGVGGTNANAHCKNCHNSGTIVNNGHATTLYMSGVAHDAGRTVTDCYNTGAITMNGTASQAFLSGLAYTSDDAITGCYNKGVISMPQGSAAICLCGLVYEVTAGSFTDCYNGEKGSTTKGAISYSSTTSKGSVSIAGTASSCGADMTNVVNYAPITIGGKTGDSVYAGGISRIIRAGKTWTECVNYGDITISAVVGDESIEGSDAGADTFVAGLVDAATAGEAASSLIRCQNHGNITYTETCKVASGVRAGGLCARLEYEVPVVVEDCWNSGNFTFNGKSSVRSGGTFYLSTGIASITKATTFSVKGSLINSGNLSVNADASSTGDLPMAGVIAYVTQGIALVEGETEALIANTGNVTINTKNTAGKRAFFGGILGYLKTGVIDERIKFINTGDITVTGEMTNCYVAGIGGACLKPIGYAECYCTISAPGAITETGEYAGYKGVSMLSGPKYQNGTYDIKDGAVGGTIVSSIDTETDAGGVTIYNPVSVTLTNENFTDYLYGFVDGAPTGAEVADRYELLTAAPTVTLPARLPVTE